MSKQKKLRNRLKDLFSDLEQERSQLPEQLEPTAGWVWECDAQGLYRACSPQTAGILGVEAEAFIGQPFGTFRLSPQSTQILAAALTGQEFPLEVTLDFLAQNGTLVATRVHIFSGSSSDPESGGFHGFNQVIQEQETIIDTSTDLVPEILPEEPKLNAAREHPTTPRVGTGRLKPPSTPGILPRGIAVENDQILSVSRPLTSTGQESLTSQRTISLASNYDGPAVLAVPLALQTQGFGLLEITDEQPGRSWSEDERRLVEEIADQLALALENARLFQETSARSEELALINRVVARVAGSLDMQESLQVIASELGQALRVRMGIALMNKTRSALVVTAEYTPHTDQPASIGTEIPIAGNASTERVLETRKPVIIARAQSDPLTASIHKLMRQYGIISLAIFPIIVGNEVIGTLGIDILEENRQLTPEEIRLVETVIAQASTAIQNARLFEAEQRRRQIADTLSETARVVGATLDLQEVSDRLLRQLAEVVDFNTASLQIIEGDQRQRLAGFSKIGADKIQDKAQLLRPVSQDPLIRAVVESKQPLVLSDTHKDPRWELLPETSHVRSWVAAPLITGDEVLGLLILDNPQPGAYDEETANLLSAIAAQAAVALRNARLFAQVQARSVQLQTAAEVSRAASSILDPNPLIQQTVNLIRERFDLYYVGLFLVDESGEWTREPGRWAVLRSGTGEAGRIQLERSHKLEIGGNSMIGQCVATSQAQVSQQAIEEEQRFTNPLLPETRSEMALPLISRGQVIGAMTIQSTRPAAFSEEDIAVLQTMADQVANALQNANLFNQTQARAGELAILNEMSRVLTANLDVNVILRNIYLYASRLVDTSTFFIALHDPESNLLSFPLATEGNQELKIPSRPFGSGLTEHVIQNGQPLLLKENVETQAIQMGINVQVTGWMAKCWLGVPVMIGERSMGIICVQSETPQHFNERHRDLLEAIATQSAIALQNARLFGQTQEALADTETLLNVTRVASSSLDFQQTLFEVLDLVLASTDFDSGLISIVNPDTDHLDLIAHRLPEPFLNNLVKNGLDNTLCDLVYRQEQSITITDLTVDPPIDVSGLLALGFKSYQGVTLEARGTILGTLCAFKRDTLTTGDKSLSLMQAVGQQIGVALQNANLFEQTLRQTEDLDVLNEMGRMLASLFDINAVAETVHEYTTRLMDTTNFYLALYDQENERLSFPLSIIDKQPYHNPGRPMASGMTEYVIRTGSPLLLRDNTLERMAELGIEFMAMGDDTPAQSWLGAPLTIGPRVIGVIAVQSITTPRLYTDRHRELLSSIASQAAIAIQNANLFAQTQQQLADLTAIQQTTAELSAALTFDEVVSSLLGNLVDSVQADQVTLFMLRGQNLVRTAVHPQPSDPSGLGQSIQLDQYPLTKRVIETRQPMAVAANDARLQPHAREAFQQAGISANATIPLVGPEGVLGTLSIARFDPGPIFNAQEVNLLNTLASQAAISLQNARLFEETQSRSEELALINRVVSAVAATLDLDESLQIVAREVGTALNLQTGIAMFNEDRTVLTLVGEHRVQGSDGSILGANIPVKDNPATQKVLKTRQPVVIEAAQKDPLTAPIHDLLKARNIHGLMITPIIVSGEVIGTLGVDIADPERSFTAEEMRLVQTIVLQASTAISNSRLFEQVQLQLTNLTTLSNVSQALASAPLDLFEVATVIAGQFSNAFETASVRVALLSGLERQLEVIGHVQTDASGAQVMGKSIGDLWSLNEQPLFAELLAKLEPRAIPSTELGLDEAGEAAVALIPLAVKGQASGMIELRGQGTDARYGKEQLNLAMTLANQAAVALENARLYMEQRATAEQLRELDKLKSQFLANMSHELRTPLNSIIGFSRVIMKGIDGPVSDLQQQDLSAIYNAGQHLLNMINDILDISKIEAGKMELAFEETQLPEIVNSVMSTARGLVKDKPVQLITAVEENLPLIKADPTRVRQILLNLISNAAKFTDEGSITVSAQRRVTPNGRPEILVTVADTGVGIAPEDQKDLFEPFTQVDGSPTRKVGGTGLGLSITRLLVELHGGEINMESTVGQGSTFYFTIPLTEATPPPPDSPGENTVLAIDDDPQVIHLYERYLRNAGYQVVALTDPKEALAYARQVRPFAITLDIMMPDFDGWQILKDLKADPEIGPIPVVICSILDQKDKGLELGAKDYLTKPILEEEFIQAIKALKEA